MSVPVQIFKWSTKLDLKPCTEFDAWSQWALKNTFAISKSVSGIPIGRPSHLTSMMGRMGMRGSNSPPAMPCLMCAYRTHVHPATHYIIANKYIKVFICIILYPRALLRIVKFRISVVHYSKNGMPKPYTVLIPFEVMPYCCASILLWGFQLQ